MALSFEQGQATSHQKWDQYTLVSSNNLKGHTSGGIGPRHSSFRKEAVNFSWALRRLNYKLLYASTVYIVRGVVLDKTGKTMDFV